jgi:hypothetical protein
MSKELADRVVALGVGWAETDGIFPTYYYPPGERWQYLSSDEFTSDWRIAGALMEMVSPIDICKRIGADRWNKDDDYDWLQDPTAIIQACVEALEEKK